MPYLPDTAVELLRTLAVEVRALREMIEADRQGRATGADAALVAAVYAVAGTRRFTSRELIEMASRPGVPEQVLSALLDGRNPNSIGIALSAAAGKPCSNGLMLTGKDGRTSKTWRVSYPQDPAKR